MRRLTSLIGLVMVTTGALSLAATGQEQRERVVNVYNWSDYIEPSVLTDFTRTTGIRVRYDIFDSNDTLETKLLAGKSGYDVVVPTAYFLERQIKAGVFQKLDKSEASQPRQCVAARSRSACRLRSRQPVRRQLHVGHGRASATTSGRCARNSRAATAGSTAGTRSSCRRNWPSSRTAASQMLDSSDDILPAALHYLGRDPNSTDPAELEKAADLVAKVRPSVRKFHSSEYLNALATGEICFVVGWSGDIKQAQKRAARSKERRRHRLRDAERRHADVLRQSRDPQGRQQCRRGARIHQLPDAARSRGARTPNFLAYANGNLASQNFVDAAIFNDPSVYPDQAMRDRLYTVHARDPQTQRMLNRLWTRIKTGR